jgi:hypothetical protein
MAYKDKIQKSKASGIVILGEPKIAKKGLEDNV